MPVSPQKYRTPTQRGPLPNFVSEVPWEYRVALGLVDDAELWHKFGYNEDVDAAAPEVLASFGGAFNQRLAAAETLDVVSDDANDVNTTGTGLQQAIVFGVDANWDAQIEVVPMNGLTPVTTSNTWLGVNRQTIYASGTGDSNAGKITATATTSSNAMAETPPGVGTSQQCIFYVPADHKFLMDWLYVNAVKSTGGGNPVVTVKIWVYSAVTDSVFEVFRDSFSTDVDERINLAPRRPFVVGEKSIVWAEVSTSANNTSVRGRFSGDVVRYQ